MVLWCLWDSKLLKTGGLLLRIIREQPGESICIAMSRTRVIPDGEVNVYNWRAQQARRQFYSPCGGRIRPNRLDSEVDTRRQKTLQCKRMHKIKEEQKQDL